MGIIQCGYAGDVIRGTWDNSTLYNIGNIVLYDNVSYRAYVENTGVIPTNSEYWVALLSHTSILNEDLDNITETGSANLGVINFPSDYFIDNIIVDAGAGIYNTYVAPAAGWVCLAITSTNTGLSGQIGTYFETTSGTRISQLQEGYGYVGTVHPMWMYLPVSKGQTAYFVRWTNNASAVSLSVTRFVYAQGEI